MAGKLNTFTPYTPYMFEFERTFDCTAFLQWIQENWTSSFWYCLVYVALVFGGQQYMATRPKFELRLPLIIWSTALAIFSILGAIRTIPELVFMIRVNGLAGSICDPSYFYGQTAVWAYLFTISKLYELGDTAFIVLRKQPLIFLHWYHHVTVFIYVSFSYTDHTAPGRWFMVMNYTVHAFMYSYYALRAMKFRLHKSINMFITTLQISQMVMGVFVIARAYQIKSEGQFFCQVSWENIRYCSMMYTSYLVLFAYFFYNAYLKPKPSPLSTKQSTHSNDKSVTVTTNVRHVNGNAAKSDSKHLNGNSIELNGNIITNGSAKKLD